MMNIPIILNRVLILCALLLYSITRQAFSIIRWRSLRTSNSRTISLNLNFSAGDVGIPKTKTEPLLVSQDSSFFPSTITISSKEYETECFQEFFIRQVPGDGGCLFHSLSVCISFLKCGKHILFDHQMRQLSYQLRNLSSDVLQRNVTLLIEDGVGMDSTTLLQDISMQYKISPSEYVQQIRNPSTWGGGPEIIALSNHFQRPIHVYKLGTRGSFLRRKSFEAEILARFGSPQFDEKAPLRVLCADGRFPRLQPGRQKEVGDHFLALFPCPSPAKFSDDNNDGEKQCPTIYPRDEGQQWTISDLEKDVAADNQQDIPPYRPTRAREPIISRLTFPFLSILRWFGAM